MRNLITYFIKYPVAANILIVMILVLGFFGLKNLNSTLVPQIDPGRIIITAVYPGASPEEIEQGIILKIEDNVKGITGVDLITSTSRENSGTVNISLIASANPNLLLQDIKNAVEEIREMLSQHPEIATENTEFNYKVRPRGKLVSVADAQGIKKTLFVYLDEFSDSSINILVYCFTKSVNWEDWLQTKEDVMHKIMEIFERNNLEFAFPSLSIYNENEN